MDQEGVENQGNMTVLYTETDTGLIFYPGAKVEAEAYLPVLDQIRKEGIQCVLVHMPFHLAILNTDAAGQVIEKFEDVTHWYIGGHSMGGAMASLYASRHQEQVDGLILLGAYLYGDYPMEKTLTVYGSLDALAAEKIDYTENTVRIEGGNHAQFGNYGEQKGDLPAEISSEEQQRQAVEAIVEFIKKQQ